MKRLLLCLVLAGCASVEKEPKGMFIPDEDLQTCQAEGGCMMVSRDKLKQFVLQYMEKAAKDASAQCLSNTWGELK